MATNLEKFRNLLSELFQFDQADLDFGIYRILNQKRDEVMQFMDYDLLPQVQNELAQYQSADQVEDKKELAKAINDAKSLQVDPESTPKVTELRQKIRTSFDPTAVEGEIFSDLYTFFRRYYQAGDFLSLRRYKKGVYAIPYEGEEVKLHWANADQYYIKSAEHFRDFTFRLSNDDANPQRVHFKIVEAQTSQNNNKAAAGKERRFILAEENSVCEENGELVIAFEYRPDSTNRKQDVLNEETALRVLQSNIAPEWLNQLGRLAPTAKNRNRTLLQKYLSDYTARNTFDYFIHKDLGGFLRRELDFFIKNEVMHLDDIEEESAPRVEQYLSKIKVMRRIAHKIITFLEQIENFQKKLWLKKKFVVETNYCVTLDRVPKVLLPQICSNIAQIEEWKRLFAIEEIQAYLNAPAYSEPLTEAFLEANPFLVLDTKYFNEDFKSTLLASFDNLDEAIDGVLIHSENFQALNLLQERYREQVKCVHIDPPYNTSTSGFLYKNNYLHSSWMTFMQNRIFPVIPLLNDKGSLLCHIDENEYERLHLLFEATLIPDAGTVIWDKRNPMNGGSGVAKQHEYILWRTKQNSPIYLNNRSILSMLNKVKKLISVYGEVTTEVRKKFATWLANNKDLTGGEKAYRFIDYDGRIYQSVSLRAPEPRSDTKFHKPLIHPLTKKPCAMPPNGFSRTPETLELMIRNNEIIFGVDETTQPRQKIFLTTTTRRQMPSVIEDAMKGKMYTDALGIEFPYCHPVSIYKEIIGSDVHENNSLILDYFAGSGTTGHAVINLNREDNGQRKYLLVEMGEYFDTVLKPRIQKVIYSKDWKSGKPVSREGSSHLFKYIRLESYEDTLNNLKAHRTPQQEKLLQSNDALREDYLLQYMLDVETRQNQSLLGLDTFATPFDYQLNIAHGDVGQTRAATIDVVETFNYLIGLRVATMKDIQGFRVLTGTLADGAKVLLIWRNIPEKSNADLDEFFKKQEYNTRDSAFDVIYVNGDNNLENLRREDEAWKVQLIEEEFGRLMWG